MEYKKDQIKKDELNRALPTRDDIKLTADMFCRLTLEDERPIDKQISSLSHEHKQAFDNLKNKWNSKPRKNPIQ